jgi:hypothetical protein
MCDGKSKTQCPLGTISAANGTSCTGCGTTGYTSTVGSFTCTTCPSGSFLDAIIGSNYSGCTGCPLGTYSSVPNSTSCTACPRGTYSDGSITTSGEIIQSTEVDIKMGNVTPMNTPRLPSTVSYTMTMDVFIETIDPGERNIIENTNVNPEWSGNPSTNSNVRKPVVYVSGLRTAWTAPNSICVEHWTDKNYQVGKCSTIPAPINQYFNFTFSVSDLTGIQLYIDGNSSGSIQLPTENTFAWATTNQWVFGNSSWGTHPDAGPLKVKNVYMYDTVLTASSVRAYVSTASRTSCTACPANTYNPIYGGLSLQNCIPCPPGGTQYSGSGGTSISVCQCLAGPTPYLYGTTCVASCPADKPYMYGATCVASCPGGRVNLTNDCY